MERDIKREASKIIIRGNKENRKIALTYDSGKEDSESVAILDTLKRADVKATFFITGVWAKRFPKVMERMVSEGHEIGNHSLDHPDMTKISYEEIINNVLEGEKAIEQVIGFKTSLFRLPYGHYNKEVLLALYEAGYKTNIYWSVDTLDWMLPPMQSIVNRILKNPQNGDIVLMHLEGHSTAEATKRVITNLKSRAYGFARVSEILY